MDKYLEEQENKKMMKSQVRKNKDNQDLSSPGINYDKGNFA